MSDVIGPAMLAVGQGMNSFSTFLPAFTEIRRQDAHLNPNFVKDVRLGEVAAVTATIGIGAIASALTKSSIPAYTSVLMSVILVTLYETSLRSTPAVTENGDD